MVQTGDWVFVLSNADTLLFGLIVTVVLTLTSLSVGFLLGFPAGAIEVYGDGVLRRVVRVAGGLLRGTPIVVILLVLFFVVSISESAFITATVGLGLRSAAYQAHLFRGALQSVDDGQLEAARATGMGKLQAIRYVVVPQALRRSMPGFQNEFTIVLKDTSIAFAIGLAELLTQGYNLFTQSGRSTAVLEVFLVISAVYFVLKFLTTRGLDRVSDYYAIPSGENR